MTSLKRETIYIFNLSFNEKNLVLSHSIDWANEFTNFFKRVNVFTMEQGAFVSSNPQITVKALKVKSNESGLSITLRTLQTLKTIFNSRQDACVFFHMSHKPAFVIGPFLRLWRIPSCLWYSHKKNSFVLQVAHKFVDFAVSTTSEAFPIKSKKLLITGHGISKRFETTLSEDIMRKGVVHLGRVVSAKRIDKIIFALASLPSKFRTLDLIGDASDIKYKNYILGLAKRLEVTLNFIGPVEKEGLSSLLQKYSICYSGTEKSVDKAPLEAAALGCFIVSNNRALIYLSGMSLLTGKPLYDKGMTKSLQNQLETVLLADKFGKKMYRRIISQRAQDLNSLNSTVSQISKTLIQGNSYFVS